MNFINQTFIPIQYVSIDALYVLNSPDIIGLHNESHFNQRNPQRRNSSCNRQGPKAYWS